MKEKAPQDEPVFDSIAEFYDETRDPLREEVLNFLIGNLSGSEDLLEIGAGTGRISIPLQNAGFNVTGADISTKMLERARSKGLRNTVIADGSNLPFASNSFDVTLVVHVFHLLNDRAKVMKEAMRVSRKCVMSLIRISDHAAVDSGPGKELRDILRDLSNEFGLSWEHGKRNSLSRGSESSIIEEFPPDRMLEIGSFTSVLSKDQMARKVLSSSGYVRHIKSISPEKRERLESEFMERVSRMPDFEVIRRNREFLVIWDKKNTS